jgi:hypothetical protein
VRTCLSTQLLLVEVISPLFRHPDVAMAISRCRWQSDTLCSHPYRHTAPRLIKDCAQDTCNINFPILDMIWHAFDTQPLTRLGHYPAQRSSLIGHDTASSPAFMTRLTVRRHPIMEMEIGNMPRSVAR